MFIATSPPTGYKNEQELQTIVSDAETFPIMKKLFERAVTGSYTSLLVRTSYYNLRPNGECWLLLVIADSCGFLLN